MFALIFHLESAFCSKRGYFRQWSFGFFFSIFDFFLTFLFRFSTGGDPLGQFAIEHVQNEWKVSVRKPLDREVMDNYLLNITASDGIFTAKAVVEVKVLDANDNDPVCEKVKSTFVVDLHLTALFRLSALPLI